MRVRRILGLTAILEYSNIPPPGAVKLGDNKHGSWATPGDHNIGVVPGLKRKGTVLLNAYLVAKGATSQLAPEAMPHQRNRPEKRCW